MIDLEHDRLDMIKHISFMNKKNINLFKDFIPNHYDEIYSLFSLLKDAAIDYHDMDFSKPKEEDDSFIFLFDLKDKYLKKLSSYIEENAVISYMRNKSFNVILRETNDSFSLVFKKC